VNDQSTKAASTLPPRCMRRCWRSSFSASRSRRSSRTLGESIPVETVSQSQFQPDHEGRARRQADERGAARAAASARPPQIRNRRQPRPRRRLISRPPRRRLRLRRPPAGPAGAGQTGAASAARAAAQPTAEEAPAPAPPVRPKETPPPKPKVRSARQDPRQGQGGTDEADQAVIRPQRDRQADRPVEDQRRSDADRRGRRRACPISTPIACRRRSPQGSTLG